MVIGDDAEIFAFSLFNVKKFQNQNQMNINENKVHLYPHYTETADNLDMNLLISTATNYSIYYSQDDYNKGVRVLEKSCWNQLLELFSSKSIITDNISLANKNGDRIKISFFGTLFYE